MRKRTSPQKNITVKEKRISWFSCVTRFCQVWEEENTMRPQFPFSVIHPMTIPYCLCALYVSTWRPDFHYLFGERLDGQIFCWLFFIRTIKPVWSLFFSIKASVRLTYPETVKLALQPVWWWLKGGAHTAFFRVHLMRKMGILGTILHLKMSGKKHI